MDGELRIQYEVLGSFLIECLMGREKEEESKKKIERGGIAHAIWMMLMDTHLDELK